MKKLLLLALVALGVSIAAQEGPPNTLTAQEKSAGWKRPGSCSRESYPSSRQAR